MSHLVWYTIRMKMIMKEQTNITEAQLLLNNHVRVNQGRFTGYTGTVNKIMADGRTLDITLFGSNKLVLLDVTFVSEIKESYDWPEQEQSLGPIANSVVKDTI